MKREYSGTKYQYQCDKNQERGEGGHEVIFSLHFFIPLCFYEELWFVDTTIGQELRQNSICYVQC